MNIKIGCIFKPVKWNRVMKEVIIKCVDLLNRDIFDGRMEGSLTLQFALDFVNEVMVIE